MVVIGIMEARKMVKKKKSIPFHIAHNYENFIHNGITFWARDKEDADKYDSIIDYGYSKIEKTIEANAIGWKIDPSEMAYLINNV